MARRPHESWGPGWPNCQRDKIVPINASGTTFPPGVRAEIAELVVILVEESKRRGYDFGRRGSGDEDYGCWGYYCRNIGGTSSPSFHSWGLAIDINAPSNPMRRPLTTDIPSWMVNLWEDFGWTWGGKWSLPDPMHFEWAGRSVADAARFTALARERFGKPSNPPSLPKPRPPAKPDPVLGDELPLRRGSRGARVARLQAALRIKADGIFGAQTEDRVRLFQAARKIAVDGIVGPRAWSHLFAEAVQFNGGIVHRRTLWFGHKDADSVRNLQQRLNDLGYKAGPVDGTYGKQTRAAVGRFQVSQGWSGKGADGLIVASRWRPVGGTRTLERLFEFPDSPFSVKG